MPTLDRALSLFGLRRKQEVPIINDGRGNRPTIRVVSTFGGESAWAYRDYESLAKHGYQGNSDVYACVSLIAQAAKSVRWDMSAGSGARASLVLLIKSGGPSLIEHWLSYLLLSGNSYIEVGRNGNGTPVSLYLLQPDKVTAKTDMEARYPTVEMWRVRDPRGIPYPVTPPDMIHSKLFNPLDPIYGMAPLEAAMLRVDAQNEGASLLKRVLERGFSPGWIEAAKDSIWEDTQVAALRARLKMSKNAGEELFLENATWHEMGFRPVDADISQQQLLSKRDIASVFHVDPALIGDTSTRTYATYRESRYALYMEAVVPLLSQFRDDWNRTIGKELNSPLQFDKDSFDAIAAARAEATDRVHKLWSVGLITQNEARRDLEYDPVQGGDVFYAPANLVPLGIESHTEEESSATGEAQLAIESVQSEIADLKRSAIQEITTLVGDIKRDIPEQILVVEHSAKVSSGPKTSESDLEPESIKYKRIGRVLVPKNMTEAEWRAIKSKRINS